MSRVKGPVLKFQKSMLLVDQYGIVVDNSECFDVNIGNYKYKEVEGWRIMVVLVRESWPARLLRNRLKELASTFEEYS